MGMQELTTFIGQVGFPIGITIYVITTVNKTLEGVKEALVDLKIVIEKGNDKNGIR